jgi:hypothetical protein
MPGYHLLSSLDALIPIVLARHRSFCFCKLSTGDNVGDPAFEALHVHIWISATVWDPEPGACATFMWTGREIYWNLVGGKAFPRRTILLSVKKAGKYQKRPKTNLASMVKTTRFSIVTAFRSDW